ncbi:hypothetical protein ACTPGW_002623 [Enterococcus faecalis]
MKKKIVLRPFAPKGLLSDVQTAQLIEWWNNTEKRNVTTREIAEICGVSRAKLSNSFRDYPERPFDEMTLKVVNKFINLYNKDIQEVKEKNREKEAVETVSSAKMAKKLIKKVSE